jgi:hypothetical protein
MQRFVTYEICINSSAFHPEMKEEFITSDEREGIRKKNSSNFSQGGGSEIKFPAILCDRLVSAKNILNFPLSD